MGDPLSALASTCPGGGWNRAGKIPASFCGWSENPSLHSARGRKFVNQLRDHGLGSFRGPGPNKLTKRTYQMQKMALDPICED
jgi:hypothetical protein